MNSLAEFKGQNAVESPGTTVFTFPEFEKLTQPDKNVNISNHSVKQKPENFSNLYPALLTSQKRIKKTQLSSPSNKCTWTTTLLNDECVSPSENTHPYAFYLYKLCVLLVKLGIWKKSRTMSRFNSDPNPFDEEEEVNPFSVTFLPSFPFLSFLRSASSCFS